MVSLVAAIVVAVAFDFTNGFHDSSNALAPWCYPVVGGERGPDHRPDAQHAAGRPRSFADLAEADQRDLGAGR